MSDERKQAYDDYAATLVELKEIGKTVAYQLGENNTENRAARIIEKQAARIAELEARLELTADDGTRIEIGECDGIGCRDETIRLLVAELNRRREDIDKYEYLLATAYQLAGLVGAPTRFLDSYALVCKSVDPDTLLPVTLDELDEFARLQAELAKARAERDNAGKAAEAMEAQVTDLICERNDLRQRVRDLTDSLRVIRSRCSDEIAALSPAEPQEPVVSHESTTNLVVDHETGNRDTQAQEPEPEGERNG